MLDIFEDLCIHHITSIKIQQKWGIIRSVFSFYTTQNSKLFLQVLYFFNRNY